jgi:hypothetical protein
MRTESGAGAPPAPAGRSVGRQAAQILPQIIIRLDMTDPSGAAGAVREALIRSGAAISDGNEPPRRRITARIPPARVNELLERLERLGRITGRPAVPSGPPELEVSVQW